MTFVCDRCARCCREHLVPVTAADVLRLAAVTSRPHSEWLALLTRSEVRGAVEPESFALLPGGLQLLTLRRVGGTCALLGDSDRPAGCLVHAARPLACRAYPFERPSLGSTALGLHRALLCPPETGYAAAREGPDQAALREELIARDRELAEYAAWLAGFNRRQRLRLALGRAPLPLEGLLEAYRRDAGSPAPQP